MRTGAAALPQRSAPFTVFANLNRFVAADQELPAPNAQAAAEITEQLLFRDPTCQPRWGPAPSSDGRPWPVQVFVRNRAASDRPVGRVHVALLAAGEVVGDDISTCCGTRVPRQEADFRLHSSPCQQCLAYWRVAHDQDEPEEETTPGEWADIDETLLYRLLIALRRPHLQDEGENS